MEKTVVPNQSQNNRLEEEEYLKINLHSAVQCSIKYVAYIYMYV